MGLRSRSIFAGVSLAAFAMVAAGGVQANDSVVKAVSDPNGWAVAGHDYGNTRFSALKQITSENVGKLHWLTLCRWRHFVPTNRLRS